MFNPNENAKLPNGAKILDRRLIGDTWVWLADFGGYHPYVTWTSLKSMPGATYHGHYFEHLYKAVEDFEERIRKHWLTQGFGSVA